MKLEPIALYPRIKREGHVLADKIGRVSEHRYLLFEKLGDGPQKCHWCSATIRWFDTGWLTRLVVDHIDGVQTNNEIGNLVPACQPCNTQRQRGGDLGGTALINCVLCGKEFKSRKTSTGVLYRRFCSRRCASRGAWEVGENARKRSNRKYYVTLMIKGHPLATERGRVCEHRVVLYEKLGPGSHPCHWCGATLTWMGMIPTRTKGYLCTDHLDSDKHNNSPGNLVPSCLPCNTRRGFGFKKIEDTDNHFTDKHGKRIRATDEVCEICGKAYKGVLGSKLKRRFCSHSCTSKWMWTCGSIRSLSGPIVEAAQGMRVI